MKARQICKYVNFIMMCVKFNEFPVRGDSDSCIDSDSSRDRAAAAVEVETQA